MNNSIRIFWKTLCLLALVSTAFSNIQAQKTTFERTKPHLISIENLEDGRHVLETNKRSRLIIIITDGIPSSIGREVRGTFHPFLPDGPCADHIAMPCADGSAPTTYYDPYEKKCVAVCDNTILVGLLLPAVQKIRE